tara:strand:+ start:39 stop:482 length:444 start_codon:yes stop_codon:yes gene_type:complete
MKIFLTFFVLFFSSAVFANSELNSKSIVCYRIFDTDKIRISAFEFKSDSDLNYYWLVDSIILNNDMIDQKFTFTTTYSTINIINNLDNKIILKINRKNLDVFQVRFDTDELLYEGNNCNVYINQDVYNNMRITEKKLIKKLTDGNIL